MSDAGAESELALPPKTSRPARAWLWGATRSALGLALLIFLVRRTAAWSEPQAFRAAAWLAAPVAILALIAGLAEAARLGLLLRSQGIALPLREGFRLVSVATLWGLVIPGGTGGDVAKIVYLCRRDRSRLVEVGLLLIVDRAVGLFSMLTTILLLGALCHVFVSEAVLLQRLLMFAGAALLLGVAAAFFSASEALRRTRLFSWATTRAPLARHILRVADALARFRGHRGAVAAAFGVSLAGNAAVATTFVLAASQFVPEMEGVRPALLAMLGMLANVIPLTPGGLGVGEAAFDALFGALGYANGAVISLVWRAGLIPIAALGAVFYAFGLDVGRHRSETQQSAVSGRTGGAP